jgi:hypothetical protein
MLWLWVVLFLWAVVHFVSAVQETKLFIMLVSSVVVGISVELIVVSFKG